MKTIVTKFHPPTTNLPARMSATVADAQGPVKRIWCAFLDDATHDKSHATAAEVMRAKMNWCGDMVGGSLPDGRRVWVFAKDETILCHCPVCVANREK